MLSIHLLAFENREVVMTSILSSLVALEYIVMQNSGAFSDDKVGSIKTLGFQWHFQNSEFNIFSTDPLWGESNHDVKSISISLGHGLICDVHTLLVTRLSYHLPAFKANPTSCIKALLSYLQLIPDKIPLE